MRVVIFFCLLVGVRAAPVEDEVTLPLPGLSVKLPWKHYSGYLNGTGDRKLHYWFIQSANPEPEYDPLVLWLNGGPGCSSLAGLLLENGPFLLQDDGRSLQMNPFSWNKVANMLYLESPVGVGYSYTNEPIEEYTDSMVAMDNYKALTHFYKKFPELKGNELFMVGESYGGYYVPTLSELILNDFHINFKGFAVGNGILDQDWIDTSMVYFFYGHGMVAEREWTELHKKCCKRGNFQRCFLQTSEECAMDVFNIYFKLYNSKVNIYNIYAKCNKQREDVLSIIPKYRIQPFLKLDELKTSLFWREVLTNVPCMDTWSMDRYMNDVRVREALHIPTHVGTWSLCSDVVFDNYKRDKRNVSQEFQVALNNQKRILIYNGDIDSVCSYQSNQWFLDDLKIKETQPYTAWGLRDEMGNIQNAGFWRGYTNLKFVTIKGAGHMVPSDKPREALHLFTSFIKDTPLE